MRTESRIEVVNNLLDQERGLILLERGQVIALYGADLARFRDRSEFYRDCEVIGPTDERPDPHPYTADQCRTCGTLPALVCIVCARQGHGDCPHVRRPATYCDLCAMIYPRVAACVDEHEPEFIEQHERDGRPHGLDSSDFTDMWALGDAADGADPAELRLMAGYLHGWLTQSGKVWPLPEVQTD